MKITVKKKKHPFVSFKFANSFPFVLKLKIQFALQFHKSLHKHSSSERRSRHPIARQRKTTRDVRGREIKTTTYSLFVLIIHSIRESVLALRQGIISPSATIIRNASVKQKDVREGEKQL